MDPKSEQISISSKLSAQEWRAAGPLALIYAVRMLGLFMLLPVMALYVSELRGVTPFLVGLAIGVYGLSQAALQIPFGTLSDRWGRKPVIAMGLGLFILGSLIAAFSDTVYGVIFGRLLQGAGAVAATIMALAADLIRPENRSKVMAIIGASIGAAFILALVLGPALYALIGGRGLFLLIALLAFASLILLWKMVPTPAQLSDIDQQRQSSLLSLLFDSRLFAFNSGILVLHAVLTAVFVVVPQLLRQHFQLGVDWHWLVYLVVMLASLGVMLPALLFAEKRNKAGGLLLWAAALLPVSLVALWAAISSALWIFLLSMVLFFACFNALEALFPAMTSKKVPVVSRGKALGVYSSCQFVGAFLGGLAGGILLEFFEPAAIFIFGSILGVIWLIIASLFLGGAGFLPRRGTVKAADEAV